MWTVTELRWARVGGAETIEPIEPVEGADLGYRAASKHFVTCVREDRDPEVTVDDGLGRFGPHGFDSPGGGGTPGDWLERKDNGD
jgi:hypothetical protein